MEGGIVDGEREGGNVRERDGGILRRFGKYMGTRRLPGRVRDESRKVEVSNKRLAGRK